MAEKTSSGNKGTRPNPPPERTPPTLPPQGPPSQQPPPIALPSDITLNRQYRSNDPEPGQQTVTGMILICFSYFCAVIFFPLSLVFIITVVQEYERTVIFRLGRLRGMNASGPGIFYVLPCVDSYRKVDLRTVTFEVATQEVLTKDSVSVSVDAVVFYRVYDPLKAVVQIANFSASTRLLAAAMLRKVIGTCDMCQLLTDRGAISHSIEKILDEVTAPWGVKVERVEIKDFALPIQLQRAMAAEAEADREARAKIIVAEGEVMASKALHEASGVLKGNPMALQLRYLQSLNTITGERPATIVFPFPMDFMDAFAVRPGDVGFGGSASRSGGHGGSNPGSGPGGSGLGSPEQGSGPPDLGLSNKSTMSQRKVAKAPNM